MDLTKPSISLVLLLSLACFILGLYLRKRWDDWQRKKLVKQLEKHFGGPLPQYKARRNRGSLTSIHWDRVLKLLKNEPTTEQVAHWKEEVKKQIRLADKSRSKRR